MTRAIVIFALILSGANWLLFLTAVVVSNLATIRLAFAGARSFSDGEADGVARMRAGAGAGEVIKATGTLAVSLKAAGPASTAAAMSLACLLVAVATAGIDKL